MSYELCFDISGEAGTFAYLPCLKAGRTGWKRRPDGNCPTLRRLVHARGANLEARGLSVK
jgi:hypothetical protein